MSRQSSKFGRVLSVSVFLIFLLAPRAASAQQRAPTVSPPKLSAFAAIPADAARQPNPQKATPESLATGKKWWTIDCAMCHGAKGDGQGETAHDMKLTIPDLSDPSTLKDHTDGELFYIIRNGHGDMPPEGPRTKPEENWDLVNYVRSLVPKDTAEAPK
jgi:mono/diheme cytochrome c family protein